MEDKKNKKLSVIWNEDKYVINLSEDVETVVPFPLAGRLLYKGKEMFEEFSISHEYSIEYYPVISPSQLSWKVKVQEDGTKASLVVEREKGGKYILCTKIPFTNKFLLKRYITWEDGQDEDSFNSFQGEVTKELAEKGVVHGVNPDIWQEIKGVKGKEEIVLAKQTDPVPPRHAQIEDFNASIPIINETQKVDFWAPKLITCEKDAVICRKTPGTEGVPGMDIFGKQIEPEPLQDYKLQAKNNCCVTDDGLEVKAEIAGAPIKLYNFTYSVERVHIIRGDVDIDTGSIVFPGDVSVTKNVLDGHYIHADGRIEINGLVSGAELKAETAIYINDNVFNSNIVLGEKHIFRTTFIKNLVSFNLDLRLLLDKTNSFMSLSLEHKPEYGQVVKRLLEKEFKRMQSKSIILSKMVNSDDESLFNRSIISAVQTLKYFFIGQNVLELKNGEYLEMCHQLINEYLENREEDTLGKMVCVVGYVQSTAISCFGDFICRKDAFNSKIKAEGDIKIFGTCRGGSIISNNKIFVYELGSSVEGEDTVVKIPKNGHLTAEYCHPNVKILIGTQRVSITQNYRKLDVYYENDKLWVDKLKWIEAKSE